MSAQTHRAMAARAVQAAAFMENYGGQLQKALDDQKIDFLEPGNATVTLPANLVTGMLWRMIPLAKEIRAFEKKLPFKARVYGI